MKMVLLPLLYALLWFTLYHALKLLKSDYTSTQFLRNNILTVMHSATVPLLTLAYLIAVLRLPFYELDTTLFGYHLYAASIGYYITSASILIYLGEQEKIMVIHHFVVAAMLLYFFLQPQFPLVYISILIPQATGFLYHNYLIFKELNNTSPHRLVTWYKMNYYGWIVLRFAFMAVVIAYYLYAEFTWFRLPISTRIIMLIGCSIAWFFSFYWMIILIKNKDKKIQEILS